ncbi:MAG TPA: signal peptidase I [Dehalococcoidia bacterium]|nr:signal peptidase I [Dehalococcoidia bacterium]
MKILGWLVTAVLALIVAGFLFVYFSPDYDMRLVRSESMRPAINMGDMVITGPVGGEVEPGTIITYQRGEELVTHRVLSVDGDTLVTKGDAVEDPDPWPVTLSDVEGVYLFKLPYVGYLANFIGTKLGWFLVIILPATALVALIVRDIFKELGRNKEPERSPEKINRQPEKVTPKREVMPKDLWD